MLSSQQRLSSDALLRDFGSPTLQYKIERERFLAGNVSRRKEQKSYESGNYKVTERRGQLDHSLALCLPLKLVLRKSSLLLA